MKVESYTVLHYGKDYLPFALKSVYNQVDRLHVVYTPTPSHNHQTNAPCPESEDELKEAALAVGPKVHWHKVTQFRYEGHHRDYALNLCRAADMALVLDADEVWPAETLERALRQVWDGSAKVWRVEFRTPWRSFNWLCRDEMKPDRFHDFRPSATEQYGYVNPEWDIYHFGYAVTDAIMAYKWKVHGHRNEARAGWFEEKWSAWPPVQDVHPTCVGFWNPEPFDKMLLPPIMRTHPFWSREMIK